MTLGLAVLASASVTWSVSPRAAIQTELRFGRTTPLVLLYPTGGPSGLSHRALNSAVECHLHTVEVVGSNPTAPTIEIAGLANFAFRTLKSLLRNSRIRTGPTCEATDKPRRIYVLDECLPISAVDDFAFPFQCISEIGTQ
jgi:hypothetical protein